MPSQQILGFDFILFYVGVQLFKSLKRATFETTLFHAPGLLPSTSPRHSFASSLASSLVTSIIYSDHQQSMTNPIVMPNIH